MVAITVMLVVAGFFFIPGRYWPTSHLQRIAICRCIWTLLLRGHKMKQTDYVRMAEKWAREADRLPPGPERDALLKKIKLFESYAKIENWISSPGLQPPN
jgi:hypothetical protein